MTLFGNYDTSLASNLMIVFEKCDPQKRALEGLKCKSAAEIDEWLEFKYFLVLENGRQFVQHKFGEERIDESSQLSWYPISTTTRTDVVRMITRNDMQLKDSPFSFGTSTDQEEGYAIEQVPGREIPYKNQFWNSITYEVSQH